MDNRRSLIIYIRLVLLIAAVILPLLIIIGVLTLEYYGGEEAYFPLPTGEIWSKDLSNEETTFFSERWFWVSLLGVFPFTILAVIMATTIFRQILGSSRRLEESETRFRNMADASPALICLADKSGERFWFNKSWRHILPDEMGDYSAAWNAHIYPEDRRAALKAIESAIRQQRAWQCEYRFIAENTDIVWIQDTALPWRDPQGELLGFVCSAFDITKFKNAELALRRYGEIVDVAGDMLAYFDRTHICLMANAAYARMFGHAPDVLIGMHASDIVGETLFLECAPFIDRAFMGEESRQTFDYMVSGSDGSQIVQTCEAEYRPFLVHGVVEGIVVSQRDVTERERKERLLRVAAVAFEAQEAIIITEQRGVIQQVNNAFTAITGVLSEAATGKAPEMILSGRYSHNPFHDAIKDAVIHGSWRDELWVRHKDGHDIPVYITISRVLDERGEVSNFVISFLDITERKAAEEKILNLAFYDTLTGLPNRRLLMERLERSIVNARRNRLLGAVLFIDLDYFKQLNDTMGHDYGDMFLVEVARRLEKCIRQSDTVARLGGDEFVAVIEWLGAEEETSRINAMQIGEKMLSELNRQFVLNGMPYQASASIGVTLFNGTSKGDILLKEADTAMYNAKHSGRNAVHFLGDLTLHAAAPPLEEKSP